MEFQILDGNSRDLRPAASEIFERIGGEQPHIKPEIFQSIVEINTGIHSDVEGVRSDLAACLLGLRRACEPLGPDLASAGSHPFAMHRDQVVHPSDRFQFLIERNRWIAERLMIFGLHVHVGMRDGNHAIAMMNGMLQFLPHVLALSASSPFWQGVDTGLASSRITVFEALPTAGHPCTFESFYDSAVASSAITSIKDLWWDIRPHPEYGTVEVRACDALPTLSEAMSVIALIALLLGWLDAGYRDGQIPRPLPTWILLENKWRASRWGLDAKVVRDGCGHTSLLRQELEDLLPRLEPLASTPGAKEGLRGVEQMLRRRGSLERQRRIFEERRSLKAVANGLVEELRSDHPAD